MNERVGLRRSRWIDSAGKRDEIEADLFKRAYAGDGQFVAIFLILTLCVVSILFEASGLP